MLRSRIGIILLALASVLTFAIPQTITYQGKLTNLDGVGENDTLEIRFNLYDVATDGDSLWTQTMADVPVIHGLFDVNIGPIDLPFDAQYWLEIVVDGEVLAPRVQLTSSPYAFRSAVADSFTGGVPFCEQDTMIAHWDSIRGIPGDIADGDDIIGTQDTMIAYWDSIRGMPASFDDGDWADNTTFIMVDGQKGILGYGNVAYGVHDSTHINLGVACTTGAVGMDNKYATVGGGYQNIASGEGSTIGGGRDNVASGMFDATVGGGSLNIAGGNSATVGGGLQNTAGNDYATVGGGTINTANGYSSVIGGGMENSVNGGFSVIAGGSANIDSADYSFVFGENNLVRATADYSVLFGLNNTVDVDSTFVIGLPYAQVQGISINDSLYFDGAWRTSWPISGLTHFAESNYIYDTRAGDKLEAIGDSANIDFVISPKGTGAILAQQPDGTTAGGVNRGTNAVDFQMSRTDTSQVASGDNSVAMGGFNTASGIYSIAMGDSNIASGDWSVAFGRLNGASGEISTAIGYRTTASGFRSTAMGDRTTASGEYSTAMGSYSIASGSYSTAMGVATASGYISTAMGRYTTASGRYSTSMGYNTSAQPFASVALGRYNVVSGDSTSWVATDPIFIIGNGANHLNRSNAFTILKNANTNIGGSLTINGNATDSSITFPTDRGTAGQVLTTDGTGGTSWSISGLTHFAESNYVYDTRAGDKLEAIGDSANIDFVISPKGAGAILAQQPDSTIEGGNNRGKYAVDLQTERTDPSQVASGENSVVMGGEFNTASGNNSVAMGLSCVASGTYSLAIGNNNDATGQSSVAFGLGTEASGNYSTAIGYHSTASANIATAIGITSRATGVASTALGSGSNASGYVATAMGNNTKALSSYETVLGRYNTEYTPLCSDICWESNDRLFVIGNGTGSSERSNALTMLKNGNTGLGTETPTNVLEVAGEASYSDASDMGTDDADFASKGYVDGEIASADDGDWTISGDDMYAGISGNIGIGTTTPSSKLTFDNTTGDGFDEWSDYKILLYTRSTPAGSYGIGVKANTLAFNTAVDFDFDQEGTTVMTIQDGKMGIGTTAPARQLHISEVMRLEPIPSAPSSPSEGDIYMDSTTHKLMVFDGTIWQACW